MVKAKFLCGWMCFVLAAPLLIPGVIHADEIEDKKESIKERDKEIQRLEKEKAMTEKERKTMFARLEEEKRKLAERNEEVYRLEQELERSKKKLKLKQDQIRERKRLFDGRLRHIYQQGDMFYLESLLDAGSLEEFINRLRYIRLLAERDRELLQQFRKDLSDLKAEQSHYKQLLADQKKQADQARSLHRELTRKYKEYEKELDHLAEKQNHLEQINEKEQEAIRKLIRREQQEKRGQKKSCKGGRFYPPVQGSVTSSYGMRWHPTQGKYKMHTGVDFGSSLGTPIRAAAGGEVIASRPSTGYGYIVVIDHGSGLSTLYAHMYAQDVKVDVGDTVSKGQVIAAVGNNGWSTGPHLHFEVLKNGEPTDPMPYLK